jgi:hypothetical protein
MEVEGVQGHVGRENRAVRANSKMQAHRSDERSREHEKQWQLGRLQSRCARAYCNRVVMLQPIVRSCQRLTQLGQTTRQLVKIPFAESVDDSGHSVSEKTLKSGALVFCRAKASCNLAVPAAASGAKRRPVAGPPARAHEKPLRSTDGAAAAYTSQFPIRSALLHRYPHA